MEIKFNRLMLLLRVAKTGEEDQEGVIVQNMTKMGKILHLGAEWLQTILAKG